MACMTRRASAVVELTAVHRFRDAGYADLTLRMRDPASKEAALAVAGELNERDLIHRVADAGQARDVMVEAYFRWANDRKRVALVTGTNEEADAINEAIQQRRLELGQLTQKRIAIGQDEQRLLEGDVVQTRLNDGRTDVENRALWIVRRILPDAIELASISDSGDLRQVPLDYAANHVHLAYASTVHGIQGETTDVSIVGPGVDASGLYVGMTRGRVRNEAIAIARSAAAAREQVADSMMRGTPEVSIDDSVRAARMELGRAARSAGTGTMDAAAGTDRHLRPLGEVADIERYIAAREQRAAELRRGLERMREWLDEAARATARLDARDASNNARKHGRSDVVRGGDRGNDPRRALAERRSAVAEDHRRLAGEYASIVRHLDDARIEQVLRDRNPADPREREDRVRAARVRDGASPSTISLRGIGL
jgi:hypothetical protein